MGQERVRVERPSPRRGDKDVPPLRPSIRPPNPNLSKQQFK